MTGSLLSLGAGFVLAVVLLWVLERDAEVKKFWTSRLLISLVLAVVLWKLTPLWTRWETVFDNPMLLVSMNGGLSAVLGGLFAFLTVMFLSLFQIRRHKPETRRWPLLASMAGGLLLTGVWTFVEPELPHAGDEPGSALQTLVPDLAGKTHALADWKGKVVVVNFWATWCAPCLAELPEFKLFTNGLSDKVALLGVNLLATEKDEASVIRFAAANKLTWTQLTDPQGTLQQAFAVTVIPTTIVLDPQGRVVDRREGVVDLFWLKTLESRFSR